MARITRRRFIKDATSVAGGLYALSRVPVLSAGERKPSDIRIESVTHRYEEHRFRTPLKFARAVVDRLTMLTAECKVRTQSGKEATGFGVLPLNYTFTYPSKNLTPAARLDAIKELVVQISKLTGEHKEFGHPIDINGELAPQYDKAAAEVSRKLQLADPIPKLCVLNTAGAFDAAVHDAFGKANGVSSFHT